MEPVPEIMYRGARTRGASTGKPVPGNPYRGASTGEQVLGCQYPEARTREPVLESQYLGASTEDLVPGNQYWCMTKNAPLNEIFTHKNYQSADILRDSKILKDNLFNIFLNSQSEEFVKCGQKAKHLLIKAKPLQRVCEMKSFLE